MKPSILLTGGSGLLGINWFNSKQNEFDIYLVLHKRKISIQKANVVYLDMSSESSIYNLINKINPTVVVHTAGLASVEKCEFDPVLAFNVNAELSGMIAKVTNQFNIPFVHISTDHLFKGNISQVLEEEPVKPLNVYGQSKALAEKIVFEYNKNSLIIRTNFFGWGTVYRHSFSDQIINSLRNNKYISLFNDVWYTPILAENLINTVHDLLDKKASGIFHVVSDDIITKYDFGMMIAEEFGLNKSYILKSNLQFNNNLIKRPLDMSLSNQKVRDFLGKSLGTVKEQIALLRKQEVDGKIHKITLL